MAGIALAVVAVGVFAVRGGDGGERAEQRELSVEEIALLGSIAKNTSGGNTTIDKVGSDPPLEGSDPTGAAGGERRFRHPRLGFTLELPDGFSAGMLEEEESGMAGETTLVRGAEGEELQIYATAFDEEGPLTPERIHKDLPDVKITSPQQVVLKGGMQALVFLSENEALGKTQEVWFSRDGFLYQMTTRAPLAKTVAQIIGSMRFE